MILLLDNKLKDKKLVEEKLEEDPLAFSKEIKEALIEYNIPFICVDKVENIDLSKITGIILSGSNLNLTKNCKINFEDFAFNLYYLSKLKVPVWGICFGCQLLDILYGGTLKHSNKFICGDFPFFKYNKSHFLFKDLDTNKFRYCFSDVIYPSKNIGVKVFATIKRNNKIYNVGFEYEKNRVFGSLFHSELKDETKKLFLNYFNYCNNYKNSSSFIQNKKLKNINKSRKIKQKKNKTIKKFKFLNF